MFVTVSLLNVKHVRSRYERREGTEYMGRSECQDVFVITLRDCLIFEGALS